MLEALLAGRGLSGVAALAAAGAGVGVVVALPGIGEPGASHGVRGDAVASIASYAGARVRDSPTPVPEPVALEVVVRAEGATLGVVVAIRGSQPPGERTPQVLAVAALVALTEVAIARTREEVELELRSTLLEEIRSGRDLEARDVVRRARRHGCDLAAGAVALCVELRDDRPGHALAVIAAEHPGALAQEIDGRVYALLPAGADAQAEETTDRVGHLAARLESTGLVGISGVCRDLSALDRAFEESELMVEITRQSGAPAQSELGSGTYRLLLRILATHPEELRRFFDETVAPLVAYDDQYRTELMATLDAYLANNCNMNATAAAIFAHRHTVAYRLERVRELTGFDPWISEDRERLGLGLKAYRMVAPDLPR
jgi:sugar diacid utilization regulator